MSFIDNVEVFVVVSSLLADVFSMLIVSGSCIYNFCCPGADKSELEVLYFRQIRCGTVVILLLLFFCKVQGLVVEIVVFFYGFLLVHF
jgi:hypothetical protein